MSCDNGLKIVGYLKTEEGNAIKGIHKCHVLYPRHLPINIPQSI